MWFLEIAQAFIRGESFPDPKMRCQFHCMLEESNLLSPKGSMEIVPLVAVLDTIPKKSQHILLMATARCPGNPKIKNLCEKFYLVHECWRKKDPDYYYF